MNKIKDKNIKLVILAGGMGTRISEETHLKPKPMIEIGNKPIIWHIMKLYSYFGINDFIICCGYRGYLIKEYFSNYYLHNSDVIFDFKNNTEQIISKKVEPWRITLVDTGQNSNTGGRVKKIKKFVQDDDFFCMTYGDGLANINIKALINFHKKNGKLATLTAVSPPARFGSLSLDKKKLVKSFKEKILSDESLISGGFFVLSPKVIDMIKDEKTIWEKEPMQKLSKINQLLAFKHQDFWHPMDTLRDKVLLENYWQSKKAPWKLWK